MNICGVQKERAELRIPASQRVNNVKDAEVCAVRASKYT